jgi:phage I-like protein
MDHSLLVDISQLQFDETGPAPTSWVQAMHHAEYTHPFFGKIKFTPERTKRFAENVAANVRGHDLDIDYDHKATSGKAAGWVKEARADDAGLHLLVEWTPEAVAAIKAKEYRYFSPEFADEWKHPSTGKKFKDVLFGGGITNRPFLKGMSPLNLSEFATPGGDVDPKILRQSLGLSEDATDAEVLAKIVENNNALAAAAAQDDDKDPSTPPAPDPALTELSEKNPAVKALMDMVNTLGATVQTQNEQLVKLAASDADKTVALALTELATKGKFALPPAVTDKLRPILVKSDPGTRKALMEVLEGIAAAGVVSLGETGAPRADGDRPGTSGARTEFENKTKALMEADKLDYATAMTRLSAAEPDLFERYRAESTAYYIGTPNPNGGGF